MYVSVCEHEQLHMLGLMIRRYCVAHEIQSTMTMDCMFAQVHK